MNGSTTWPFSTSREWLALPRFGFGSARPSPKILLQIGILRGKLLQGTFVSELNVETQGDLESDVSNKKSYCDMKSLVNSQADPERISTISDSHFPNEDATDDIYSMPWARG